MRVVPAVADKQLAPPPYTDSRGANCCAEIRTILQCDPVGPCMGYDGDCGDFQEQFAGVQGSYLFSDTVGDPPTEHEFIHDWVCHAFPDDAYVTGAAPPAKNAHPHRRLALTRYSATLTRPTHTPARRSIFRGPHLRRRRAAR